MQFPFSSKVLHRHRTEDERGLHFDWHRYPDLLAVIEQVIQVAPQQHVPDPAQALQDAFSMALHTAQAVQVSAGDGAASGDQEWTGQPVWLEFETPQTFGPTEFEGALVFQLPISTHRLIIPILMGRTLEWPLPLVVTGSLLSLQATVTGTDPASQALRTVLNALSHVPPLPQAPVQHESNGTLLARLERHLKRVSTLAPRTAGALPRLYLKEWASWDRRTFVPTALTAALLHTQDEDGMAERSALVTAPEVTVLTAWRYAKHVIRIDEDVLTRLRRAKPLARLPEVLPATLWMPW